MYGCLYVCLLLFQKKYTERICMKFGTETDYSIPADCDLTLSSWQGLCVSMILGALQ